MITEITGNLLDFPNGVNIITHGCNTQSKMGSGLAKQIAHRWPCVEHADKQFAYKGWDRLGKFSYILVDDDRTVVNLYQQSTIGGLERNIDYEAFYAGLEKIEKFFCINTHGEDEHHFGFPCLIGCYRAKGSWPIVRTMIDEVFKKRKVTIVNYNEFPPSSS